MEEEYPNKETEKLLEGVVEGNEEIVKVLLLGNKNKQFELDINFQFKEKVCFLSNSNFSLSFSLSLFCCFMLIVNDYVVLCDIYFVFILF